MTRRYKTHHPLAGGPRRERDPSKHTSTRIRDLQRYGADDNPQRAFKSHRRTRTITQRHNLGSFERSRCLVCQRHHTVFFELRRSRRRAGRVRDEKVQVQSVLDTIKGKLTPKKDGKDEGTKPKKESKKELEKKRKEELQKIEAGYIIPKNPVVFCHGLFGFDTMKFGIPNIPFKIEYWDGIKKKLKEKGVDALMTQVPPTSGTHDRAKVLMKAIEEKYAGKSVHLIGHSMGGIDCRYLASHLKERKFKILSITTIGTPHKGSSFADYIVDNLGKALPALLKFLKWLPIMKGDGKAMEDLTKKHMEDFNKQTPDVPDIKYYSWGAEVEPGLSNVFKFPHSVVLPKEGPNDGLVSLQSAKWGSYQGTLENVDHIDLIGWVNRVKRKLAEVAGRRSEFVPTLFYFKILDQLAREVEKRASSGAQTKVAAPAKTSTPKAATTKR